jgi:hypothetical protein
MAKEFAASVHLPWWTARTVASEDVVLGPGPERRIITDRGVQRVNQPIRLTRITARPNRDIAIFTTICAAYLASWTAGLAGVSTTAAVVAGCLTVPAAALAGLFVYLYWRGPRQLVYSPHQFACAASEYKNGSSSETVALSARQKLLRVAAAPIPDELSTEVLSGTEHMLTVHIPTLPFFGQVTQASSHLAWAPTAF